MIDDFAVFILTQGRAKSLTTIRALDHSNYTGKIYLILDNEDKTIDLYKEIYGAERVIVFDKEKIMDRIDKMDNKREKKAILYARHACFDIAKGLGLKYFIQLDDDYVSFDYRFIDDRKILVGKRIQDLNNVFEYIIEYMENTKALTIAMCQGGDFMGGRDGDRWRKGFLRKAMNTFICSTDKPIDFRGTMNEDVTMYTTHGSRGYLIMSITSLCITQKESQSLEGGMTDTYQEGGTYIKSFYSVMAHPSSVKIAMLISNYSRIHHKIKWKNTVPCILREEIKNANTQIKTS